MSDENLIRQTLYAGRKGENDLLLLRCLPTPGLSTRWCLRVPKRLGSAPQRNRVRRLMREFIRTNKSIWPPECAVVISARPTAQRASYQQIAQQLGALIATE